MNDPSRQGISARGGDLYPVPSPGPTTRESNEQPPDWSRLLRTVWTHRWPALGVFSAVLAVAVFWTLQQQRVYQAGCILEYDPNPPRPLGRDVEDVNLPVSNYWMSREFFETQNKILASRRVAEAVVRRLELHHDADFMGVAGDEQATWRGTSVERAAVRLRSRLEVEPVRETRLVRVMVSDEEPRRAAALANAVADAYIEKTVEDRLGSTVSALEWLGQQLDTLRNDLENSETALHDFKQESNVLSLSLEDRQNIVAGDIQHFSEELAKNESRRIELTARLQQLQAANAEDPMAVHATAVLSDPTIAEFRRLYRQKVTERDALSATYGESHPRMTAVTNELTALKDDVRREIDALTAAAKRDIEEMRQVEGGLRFALEEANQAGLELNLKEIQYSRLVRERENNAKLYDLLLQRTAETDLTRMLKVTHVRVLDRALVPRDPISPRVALNLVAGGVTGIALALAVAFLLGRADRRLKTREDVEGLGAPLLGEFLSFRSPASAASGKAVPRRAALSGLQELIIHGDPKSGPAESVRGIRTNLTFMSPDRPLRALLITSAGTREGKTTVAANLAAALAQSGLRTLLVDTDLRKPRLHRLFGVSNEEGVTSLLVSSDPISQVTHATTVSGLELLTSGPIPPNPSEILHSERFTRFLSVAVAEYDRVILDSPPLGAVTDAAVIAAQVSGVVLVVRAAQTTRDAGRAALRQLRDVSAHVLGVVLNGADPRGGGYGYSGYYYAYGRVPYGAAGDDDEREASVS